MSDLCVFCEIVQGRAAASVARQEPDAWLIKPLRPITPGHMLVVPTVHVIDAIEDPDVTATAMRLAAKWAQAPCNIITSVGAEATQTVFHLHVHIVPRRAGDGLPLPWTPQQNLPAAPVEPDTNEECE